MNRIINRLSVIQGTINIQKGVWIMKRDDKRMSFGCLKWLEKKNEKRKTDQSK